MPNVKCQMSNVKGQMTNVKCQMTNFKLSQKMLWDLKICRALIKLTQKYFQYFSIYPDNERAIISALCHFAFYPSIPFA